MSARRLSLIETGVLLAAVWGVALSIFPSFQVPCAYIVLVLLAACLYRDHERICFSRTGALRLLLVVAAILDTVRRFVVTSQDELATLLGKCGPGSRWRFLPRTGLCASFWPSRTATASIG